MGGYLAGPMVVPRLMHLSPPSTGIFEAASGIIDTPPCSTESLIPTAGYCGTLVPVTVRLSSFLKQAKRRPFREVICRWVVCRRSISGTSSYCVEGLCNRCVHRRSDRCAEFTRRGFRRRKDQELPQVVAKRSKRRGDLCATRRES